MQVSEHLRRKLVRAGIVGALFGLLIAFGGYVVESEHVYLVTGPAKPPVSIYAWHAVATVLATTAVYVLLLGILPLALEQLLAWFKDRKDGRA